MTDKKTQETLEILAKVGERIDSMTTKEVQEFLDEGPMTDWRIYYDEPAECRDCGWQGEAVSCPVTGAGDPACPECGRDDIKFHAPREDAHGE